MRASSGCPQSFLVLLSIQHKFLSLFFPINQLSDSWPSFYWDSQVVVWLIKLGSYCVDFVFKSVAQGLNECWVRSLDWSDHSVRHLTLGVRWRVNCPVNGLCWNDLLGLLIKVQLEITDHSFKNISLILTDHAIKFRWINQSSLKDLFWLKITCARLTLLALRQTSYCNVILVGHLLDLAFGVYECLVEASNLQLTLLDRFIV